MAARRERRTPDLVDEVAGALAGGEPLDLLALTSSFLAATDPRERRLFGAQDEPSLPPREEIVETFFEVPIPETSALLTAIAVLTGDDVLRSRVRREVATRAHVLPHWLAELDRARAHDRALQMTDVLGDGENLVLGVRLPGGPELSVAVYVDHNLGTVAKDGFVVPGALPDLVELMRSESDDPDVTLTELDPADARARITEAVEHGAMVFPPLETETWPACRPLVEWAAGLLPAGGRGYERPKWSEADRQALAERCLASPFAAGLDDADSRDLLDTLLWFGTDYGPRDPLRWSPVAVEIVLTDWIPRKIVADFRYLAKAPAVLRALIRFSHAERGIRPGLTEETLAAVDEWEPEYQAAIRAPRLQGPEALLAAVGALDPEEYLDAVQLDELRRAVGGARALDGLDGLDDALLPDEPFVEKRVPADVRDRVAEVRELVDRCCDGLLDVEHRTAARWLLAAVADGDPAVFRRRGRAETAAAAICWLVAKANRSLGPGGPQAQELLGWFGVRSASQRSEPMLAAIGVDPHQPGERALESPTYLTAARRRQLIADRDRLAGATEDDDLDALAEHAARTSPDDLD
ncbi:hypothetical protein Gobs01_02272 [Geodermatophilus obscurus DSM 43160]|uniref:DUF6398 domain-containing protein n=1 Tax=Geodermatophilus obscurus (strain ATCC 25078 / DSM 43160 / JCM 3152 / CCUG 61914 / KCC A-0152 / KCTC 9177 / NBRC 13315 / NRRL B-3577 / G-20) TaxID=526225 RepID=D2SCG7_GEOOG|nr:hypothetical protein Gobs_3714 [Geodermatophilus obscurus DSM 43160]